MNKALLYHGSMTACGGILGFMGLSSVISEEVTPIGSVEILRGWYVFVVVLNIDHVLRREKYVEINIQ